jgi:hypothetical protein
MNIVTKTAGVVLAAAALCGIGASAAFAATPTGPAPHAAAESSNTSSHSSSQVGAPQYSRGFHIYNLTSKPMTLLSVTGDGNFEGKPDVGSVLPPGQYADFEVQYRFAYNQNDDIVYTDGIHVGAIPGVNMFDAHLTVKGQDGTTSSSCTVTSGTDTCTDPSDNGIVIGFLEPAGTVVNYDSAHAQQQANALNELCTFDADAHCTFTPTNETHLNGEQHQVGDTFTNDSNLEADAAITRKDTVDISDSDNIPLTADSELFKIANASISATYNHEMTTSHDFDESMVAHVPPMTKVWLLDSPPMIRDTGNVSIAVGNTAINCLGVYFDSPDPNGSGNWTLMSQPLAGGPIHATALH